MISPINSVVRTINKRVVAAFPDAPIKMRGIAETIRKRINENTVVFFPVESEAELKEIISPNDASAIEGYHKMSTFTMSPVARTGYGRGQEKVSSVFNMSMFVFVDTEKVKVDLAGIMFTVSAAMNIGVARADDFELMSVIPSGGSVSSSDVLASEYRLESSPFKLSWQMFRLNYNLTLQYDPACFKICK